MGWEDRPYYRDRPRSSGNPLMWILTGSVPLFTAFGIRVRAHAMLLIAVVLILLFGYGYGGATVAERVQGASVLFLIVLLHEFGHCFTARWVGGEADEILMHPLGGLAFARPPHRPLPTFLTVAGGPAVNVVICLLCGGLLYWQTGQLPWNPFRFYDPNDYGVDSTWLSVLAYAYWIYLISFQLLVFNLLPIFPLDGGQMVQAILWPKFGYYKSMIFACNTGMAGCVVGGMIGLASGSLGLGILAVLGFMGCLSRRRQILAAGPWAFSEDSEPDYAASLRGPTRRERRSTQQAISRAKQRAQQEAAERVKIDAILAKVSSQGMNSLSWWEKRVLKHATEQQRKRDLERSKSRHG